MSPYQHGEVFVTKDGSETDLDLGHYERFIDIELTRSSNLTAGQIYLSLISKERRGDYLGGTIQTVSHVTNEIKERIRTLANESKADVVVVEVGGTVGDIEGQPFLESIRQMRNEVGKDSVFFVHLTLLPYITATGELKTKPTQHSVKELRAIGIQPDAIVCRSDHPVSDSIREKIGLFCDVPVKAAIPLLTVDNIYRVPMILEEWGLGDLLVDSLNLKPGPCDMTEWKSMVDTMRSHRNKVTIAMVGKYVELRDAYISVREALQHAGFYHDSDIDIHWIRAEDIEIEGPGPFLKTVSGIVVPGGFGSRGVKGMVETARYARENGIPYFGLCLGLQVMVIEYARNVLGLSDANSSEMDEQCAEQVVHIMPDQINISEKGGTMRLGDYPCSLLEGTQAHRAYGSELVYERHRHRYELNNIYRESLENAGLIASGLSPDGNLVEISEVEGHPFMVGTQFHPEFRSRPNRPHPLFRDFVGAAIQILRDGSQSPLPLEQVESVQHGTTNLIE
jgi:CTP synthase